MRTYIIVLEIVPDVGVNESEEANPVVEFCDISKFDGAVIIIFVVIFVPETVNACTAEGVPTVAENAVKLAEVVITAFGFVAVPLTATF